MKFKRPCDIGQRFGRLTILDVIHNEEATLDRERHRVIAICDCGTHIELPRSWVVSGNTSSCGCLRLERLRKKITVHGEARTHLHMVWVSMKARCHGPGKTSGYSNYGARGIAVCRGWQQSYPVFRDWALSAGYRDGLTIDRIDVNGDYEPLNCRFVDVIAQANNKRNNRYLTIFGETKTIADWSRDSRCAAPTEIYKRLHRGWTAEDALTRELRRR